MNVKTSPFLRQWLLLRTLSGRHHGATVRELVDELAASDKTIRRDLEALSSAGFPLREDVERFGRKKWRLDPGRTPADMCFAFDEAIALYLGQRFLEPLAGTLFWDAACRAFHKIRACLGPAALRYLDQFAAAYHQTTFGQRDYARQAELLDQLVMAIEERRIIRLTYRALRSPDGATYAAHPYGLTYHRGALYLVGHAPDRNAVRHWKIARVTDVELTDDRFALPPDFTLAAHFAHSFGIYEGQGEVHIRIRFAAEVARYVEESRWHASQQLTPQADGSLLAEFDLSSTTEIKTWILSFGRHAVVEEPEGLREEIAADAAALLRAYGGQEPHTVPSKRRDTSPPDSPSDRQQYEMGE